MFSFFSLNEFVDDCFYQRKIQVALLLSMIAVHFAVLSNLSILLIMFAIV